MLSVCSPPTYSFDLLATPLSSSRSSSSLGFILPCCCCCFSGRLSCPTLSPPPFEKSKCRTEREAQLPHHSEHCSEWQVISAALTNIIQPACGWTYEQRKWDRISAVATQNQKSKTQLDHFQVLFLPLFYRQCCTFYYITLLDD